MYYTVARWLEQHPDTLLEQQQQLAELIRLTQCTPTYLSSVICGENSWIRGCISNGDLFKACAFCGTSSSSKMDTLPDIAGYKPQMLVIKRYPSWAIPCRPASAVKELDFIMTVPLAKLQAKFEESVPQKGNVTVKLSRRTWQGRSICCKLTCIPRGNGTSRLGCLISSGAMSSCLAREYCVHFTVQGHVHNGEAVYVQKVKSAKISVREGYGLGASDALRMGAHSSWEALEQQLRDKGWVHADGCVHVSVIVHALT